jgi:hypothetical protein
VEEPRPPARIQGYDAFVYFTEEPYQLADGPQRIGVDAPVQPVQVVVRGDVDDAGRVETKTVPAL